MHLPKTMQAVQLVGHGGLEKLVYRHDVPLPDIKDNEMLINVRAAGVNNTDINTRIGWYSKSVTTDTNQGGAAGFDDVDTGDATWSGKALSLPRIQGADCTGYVAAVGSAVDDGWIGRRVMARPMMADPLNDDPFACYTIGSECDGAFAQFTAVPASEVFPINSSWSDVEIASIPCAYSTAENMLHRANLGAETVLITGASGGVGLAAVQLAKRRGAHVIAIAGAVAGASKAAAVQSWGADRVIDRGTDLLEALGNNAVDLVVDLVAGDSWPKLLDILKSGGRYVTSGAIAGPLVTLDVRTLYLKDLTLIGATCQERIVFENLIKYIERGEIKPAIAAVFPLAEIHKAQTMFLDKNFVGKIVLEVPPL